METPPKLRLQPLAYCCLLSLFALLIPNAHANEEFKGALFSYKAMAGYQQLNGDIEQFLLAITYADEVAEGGSETGPDVRWHERSDAELTAFATAITALYSNNADQAASYAAPLGIDVVQFTDTTQGSAWSGRTYLLLIDRAQHWADEQIHTEGIFIAYPQASHPLIVQVPHPKNDSKTNLQGIGVFLQADVTGLFLAGVHRRNFPTQVQCQNGASSDYRKSDGAHNIEHTFQTAHVATQDLFGSNIYYLQFHGFGSGSYNTLADQCYPNTNDTRPDDPGISTDDAWMINISDTWNNTGDPQEDIPPNDSFVHTIYNTFETEGQVKPCIYNRDTFNLGGTINVQARYTNGVSNLRTDTPNVCSSSGGMGVTHTDQFIHVEQSYYLRNNQTARDLSIQLYSDAIADYFQ